MSTVAKASVVKDWANTPEAIKKREERRKKRETGQQKTDKSAEVIQPHHLSRSEKERETVKERIENVTNQMRQDRKKFLTSQIEDWKTTNDKLREEVQFLTSPYGFLYDRYPIQMAEFLTEAIKYPDNEIRQACCNFFTRMQRPNSLNTFLWKMIFSADFVPKTARDYFLSHQDVFKENPLLWSLAEKARSKFAGNEDRLSPEIIKREEIKADIEKIYHTLRHQRKTYFNTLKKKDLAVSDEMLEQISAFCDMKYYKEFPIQIANLIYEGSKYPVKTVSQIALTFWEKSLKLGNSDPFLWAKMMLSDFVTDEVWAYLFAYHDILANQKNNLFFYIKLKETHGRNRSAEQDKLYRDVCRLYY